MAVVEDNISAEKSADDDDDEETGVEESSSSSTEEWLERERCIWCIGDILVLFFVGSLGEILCRSRNRKMQHQFKFVNIKGEESRNLNEPE